MQVKTKLIGAHRKVTWLPYILYGLLALLILLPLFKPGFILTLDMIFAPHIRMPSSVGNGYLLQVLLHILNFALPSEIIEKILLLTILLLSALGMHCLVEYLHGESRGLPTHVGTYFAGLLYMINPFTYDRFMAGQYNVLLGYALLPWFMRALLRFLAYVDLRRILVLSVWTIALSIVSIHTIGMAALIGSLALAVQMWRHRHNPARIKATLKWLGLGVALFIFVDSYWLVPLTLGKGNTAETIAAFSSNDRQAFSTLGSSAIGQIANVIRLQGFWVEGRDMYDLPQAYIHGWGLLALLIWILVVIGSVRLWRKGQPGSVIIFASLGVLAIILAIGTYNDWLVRHLPFFAGYREPEKFVAMLALSYALLAANGVTRMVEYCRGQGGKVLAIFASLLLLITPLMWTRTMFWGFNGQLAPVHYPADWYAINAQLDSDKSNFRVLFLPWHLYMGYGFAGRIIANPAPKFFDKPTIISNDPEFKGAASNPSVEATALSRILKTAPQQDHLGGELAKYHIKYVLLARDNDFALYGYLRRQVDLQLITSGPTLELYRNQAF